MATAELPKSTAQATERPQSDALTSVSLDPLDMLASLRLTVWLFAAAILLILFGTLAQVHYDVWYVVRESHFQVWWAWVEWRAIGRLVEMLDVFQLTDWDTPSTAGFYFPGGKLIGVLMLLNLLAAHSVRFTAQARGGRLALGLAVFALGVLAVTGVVLSGSGETVESELSPLTSALLWHGLQATVAAVAVAGLYWLIGAWGRIRSAEWAIGALLVGMVVAGAGWLLFDSSVRLDDAGLRILWSLAKATGAGLVLLAGCVLIFGKRAGIVVIHGGVGLLMFGEVLTGLSAEEGNMQIDEGQTVNYAYDIRTTELAFVDRSDPETQRVSVVPQRYLENASPNRAISHPELPVDFRVVRFFPNSALALPGEEANPATLGAGLSVAAKPVESASGVDGGGVNVPSAYIELLNKQTRESLGVYLVSTSSSRRIGILEPQPVEVDGKTYDVELRFKRLYKRYAVKLHDFQFDRYPGTEIPKDFRSEVQLIDPDRGVDRRIPIYMNNPLRYDGDTLYQSSYDQATEKTTYLQVVSNTGWLIPYLSCQIVLIGMLAHFGQTLSVFLRRRTDEARRAAKQTGDAGPSIHWTSPSLLVPVLIGVLWAGYLSSKTRPEVDKPREMQFVAFGNLPITDGGRVKPYDTLARNTLQRLANRQTVAVEGGEKMPATQWLLELVSGKPSAHDLPVFRIDNLEVLDLLKLKRRPGDFKYSYNEVFGGENEATISQQYELVRGVDPDEYTLFQAKFSDLVGKITLYRGLVHAFAPLPITGDPDRIGQDLQIATQGALLANQNRAPRVAPPAEPGGEWLSQYEAQLNELFRRFPAIRDRIVQVFAGAPMVQGQLADMLARFDKAGDSGASRMLGEALDAYRKDDVDTFNARVLSLKKLLAELETEQNDPANDELVGDMIPSERVSLTKSGFEAKFNRISPFFLCRVSYILAFAFCAGSFLFLPKTLGRATVAIIVVTLVLHTLAIAGRVYISGRPPITNLYSSAVVIGWAVVLAGLLLEAIFRMGIGSLMASVFGVVTLVHADFLAQDGDTLTVMQAVLDTQFWLATHVICVAFGYAATYVAGIIGIVYLVAGHLFGAFNAAEQRTVARMIYGTLCFAIFFSFVGTVLGGLWGDNSWGRFWGWDPKENGALIIVLWNALILHARWGKMVDNAGLAALAVAGNIFTTWSWFGTNELGVGLHAYGGLAGEVSQNLKFMRWVFFTHPVVIALAFLPRGFLRAQPKPAAA